MSREADGRYKTGFCGNPKGRPRKEKRTFTATQLRRDFLLATEEELTVPIAGKRKKMPAIKLINMQLIRKAAAGNERCMFRVMDVRRQLIAEIVAERISLMQELLEKQQTYKDSPQDFTDEILALMQEARELLADEYTIH